MAGDWIKVECTTPDKPEVHAMAAALGIPPEQVLGGLLRVWIWADQQSVNGNALSVTETVLDRVACVTGLAKAMRESGWLKGQDGRLSLPNFDAHNGKTAKSRALTNSRVKRLRNGDGVTDALPEKRERRDIGVDVEGLELEGGVGGNKNGALALPDWLNADTWAAYVKIRPARARRPESLKAALLKLEKFRAAGHDANAIVANSLANGWQMLKEPDGRGQSAPPPDYSSLVNQ